MEYQKRLGLKAERVNENVFLGRDVSMDKNVVLGYLPEREISDIKTVIGDTARIRAGTTIYAGVTIGKNLNTGHNVVIREENLIGNNFNIWSNSILDYGCKIGNDVKIHCSVYVAQFTTIEDDVFIAPGVAIANDIHPGCAFFRECMKGPTIKKGAKIGVNATVSPRVIIGEYSFIGSGSVVTKDVPPRTVVFGNPATVKKSVYDLVCTTGITDVPYKPEETGE